MSMNINNYILLHTTGNLYWKDKSGYYLGCNLEFAKISGLHSPKEIVGKSDRDLFLDTLGEEGIKRLVELDQYVISSNAEQVSEEVGIDKEGNKAYYITKKIPLKDEQGNVVGLIGNSLNITEYKQKDEELRQAKEREEKLRNAKEKAEAANKAKTEFLENMRHDIRTPLVGIIGFAEIIKNEVADPKIKEYADSLMASGYALMDLLNEILEAIKVTSGEVPLLKKKFNLQMKLNEIILLNQAKAFQKSIQLSFECDSAIPNHLIGDSTRIHRIVLELVTNALNFTHKGHVKLSAKLAKDNENDVIIKIIVEDTGIGIPPDKQQEIYLQFKRLTPSYEGIYKGYGLGLSIAKQLIDDVQGEIYVESEVGVGSKFIFIVKLKKALLDEELGSETIAPLDESKLIPLIEVKADSAPAAHGETIKPYASRILLVEDSPIAANVVTAMLSGLNCTVEVADKGKLAVQLAMETQFDLIFMDIGLPDIDGYETTKRIRLDELNKNHVPIIALTAHAGEENKKFCIDIGMNAVLTKPLVPDKAEDILNSFIPYRRDRLNIAEKPDAAAKAVNHEVLAVFDFELLKRQLNSEKTAIEMATLFLTGLPQEVAEIQAAYEKGDWTIVQNLTHKLKGGVSYCGALRLQQTCGQLEHAIRAGESGLFEKLYGALLSDIALTETEIKATLNKN